MNCFNHREKPALGVCRSCGKGLCEECLQEVTNGLACKGKCEERVALINKSIDAYPQTLDAGRKALKRSARFALALGLIFLLLSLFELLCANFFLFAFLGVTGIVFAVFGTIATRRKNQYPE